MLELSIEHCKDPRDRFMLILSERIDHLENKIETLQNNMVDHHRRHLTISIPPTPPPPPPQTYIHRQRSTPPSMSRIGRMSLDINKNNNIKIHPVPQEARLH